MDKEVIHKDIRRSFKINEAFGFGKPGKIELAETLMRGKKYFKQGMDTRFLIRSLREDFKGPNNLKNYFGLIHDRGDLELELEAMKYGQKQERLPDDAIYLTLLRFETIYLQPWQQKIWAKEVDKYAKKLSRKSLLEVNRLVIKNKTVMGSMTTERATKLLLSLGVKPEIVAEMMRDDPRFPTPAKKSTAASRAAAAREPLPMIVAEMMKNNPRFPTPTTKPTAAAREPPPKPKVQIGSEIGTDAPSLDRYDCIDRLCEMGITTRKEYRNWLLKNHPDRPDAAYSPGYVAQVTSCVGDGILCGEEEIEEWMGEHYDQEEVPEPASKKPASRGPDESREGASQRPRTEKLTISSRPATARQPRSKKDVRENPMLLFPPPKKSIAEGSIEQLPPEKRKLPKFLFPSQKSRGERKRTTRKGASKKSSRKGRKSSSRKCQREVLKKGPKGGLYYLTKGGYRAYCPKV